jgi:phosphatidylglycerophosphatase A
LTPESRQSYPRSSSLAPPTTRAERTGKKEERRKKKKKEKEERREKKEASRLSKPPGKRKAKAQGSSAIETPDLSNPEQIQQVGSSPLSASEAFRSPAVWIGTAGGFGYAPIVSGTFGSAAGVLLFMALPWLDLALGGLLWLHLGLIVVVSLAGIWAAGRCEELFGNKDDGRIVIDEVAGQLITLTPVLVLGAGALSARGTGISELSTGAPAWWLLVVTAFVVFRVLDIWKPGPIRWAERNFAGGLGVMADDLLAGLFGAILMTVPCYVLLIVSLEPSGLSKWLG